MGRTIFPIRSLWIVAGVVYMGGSCISLIWLRNTLDNGLLVVMWILFLVWASDCGAYALGRLIGGPKLAPRISPNKTWAGIFFGWITVITFYYILKSFNLFVSDFFVFIFFGIALSSQVGDFIESYIKRNLGVKDTGNIIPGHGGLLDRFDGLICASFFVKIIDFYLTA